MTWCACLVDKLLVVTSNINDGEFNPRPGIYSNEGPTFHHCQNTGRHRDSEEQSTSQTVSVLSHCSDTGPYNTTSMSCQRLFNLTFNLSRQADFSTAELHHSAVSCHQCRIKYLLPFMTLKALSCHGFKSFLLTHDLLPPLLVSALHDL